jgi:hypothetical protein
LSLQLAMTSIVVAPIGSKIGRLRLLAALVALPPVDALLGYLAFPIVWWLGDHGAFRPIASDGMALWSATVAGALGLFITITAALPVTWWLIRRGHTSAPSFALAGVVLGNVPFAAYLCFILRATLEHLVAGTLGNHLSPAAELLAGGLRVVVIGSTMGAASGVMFWFIAVSRWRAE